MNTKSTNDTHGVCLRWGHRCRPLLLSLRVVATGALWIVVAEELEFDRGQRLWRCCDGRTTSSVWLNLHMSPPHLLSNSTRVLQLFCAIAYIHSTAQLAALSQSATNSAAENHLRLIDNIIVAGVAQYGGPATGRVASERCRPARKKAVGSTARADPQTIPAGLQG